MPRACWGSQSRSGRSQCRSSRFTLQFRRSAHPGGRRGQTGARTARRHLAVAPRRQNGQDRLDALRIDRAGPEHAHRQPCVPKPSGWCAPPRDRRQRRLQWATPASLLSAIPSTHRHRLNDEFHGIDPQPALPSRSWPPPGTQPLSTTSRYMIDCGCSDPPEPAQSVGLRGRLLVVRMPGSGGRSPRAAPPRRGRARKGRHPDRCRAGLVLLRCSLRSSGRRFPGAAVRSRAAPTLRLPALGSSSGSSVVVFDVSAGALQVLVGDVALQVGPDGARLQRVDGDAVACPAPGRLHCEKHVGRLRLCVGVPRLVGTLQEVDVVEDHR